MIRHSSSLFISLFFHLFLGLILLYLYINKPIKKENPHSPKKTVIKLSSFIKKKPLVIPVPIKKAIPKKIKKKIVKKIKKRVLKKKIVKHKKNITKKVVPIKKEKRKEKIKKQQELAKKIEKTVIKKVQPIPPQKTQEEIQREQKENYIVNYIDNNLYKIRELIKDNLYYPRKARRKKITGEVVLKFRLKTDGEIDNIKVISSNHKILSRSAIQTIKNLSSQFPKPRIEMILRIPIDYSLN